MRYLLDTNILIFSILEADKISDDVFSILDDMGNVLYVSSVSIQEFVHLQKIGKIRFNKKNQIDVLELIEGRGINLLPVKKEHLRTYVELSPCANHNDPNDHVIISQAITERMPLISSDLKFKQYANQKLNHIYNNPK